MVPCGPGTVFWRTVFLGHDDACNSPGNNVGRDRGNDVARAHRATGAVVTFRKRGPNMEHRRRADHPGTRLEAVERMRSEHAMTTRSRLPASRRLSLIPPV
jgi:hypothetical protein